MPFIKFRKFFLFSVYWELLAWIDVGFLSNYFPASVERIMWFSFLILLTWWIPRMALRLLTHLAWLFCALRPVSTTLEQAEWWKMGVGGAVCIVVLGGFQVTSILKGKAKEVDGALPGDQARDNGRWSFMAMSLFYVRTFNKEASFLRFSACPIQLNHMAEVGRILNVCLEFSKAGMKPIA